MDLISHAVGLFLVLNFLLSRVPLRFDRWNKCRAIEQVHRYVQHHGIGGIAATVVLPPEGPPRERWLTRSEAARLIWAAWRYREIQKGKPTDRRSREHVARFILIALYTAPAPAPRAAQPFKPLSAIAGSTSTAGFSTADLQDGGRQRNDSLRFSLPDQLLAHRRRWKRRWPRFAVEWNGRPVNSVDKAFANAVRTARLSDDVTPHVLRHTAATWLMKAAGYLSMTVEMLSQRYRHHHPAHLARATASSRYLWRNLWR
jgi:integrase